MLKRISTLLLCLMVVASSALLVACPSDDGDTSANVSGAATDGFSNEAKNCGGVDVTILGYAKEGYAGAQVDIEESSEEPVEDAFFKRNTFINEQYGINIDLVYPENGENALNMLRNDMTSGLGEYDAVVNTFHNLASLASEGLLQDIKSIGNGYIHLDKEWWDQTVIKDTLINDRIFFINGDALVTDDEATWAMYFNKDIVRTYSLEDPYQLVRDGKWTIDKMYELVQKVELTHGSVKSYDPEVGDIWGMLVQTYDFQMFMQGCAQAMVDNSGDIPVLRVEEEANVNTFKKIAEFFIFDNVNVGVADYHGKWNDTPSCYDKEIQIFANGNALFMPNAITRVSNQAMREAEINYGILPMPKRDETQTNYTSGINTYDCGVIAIPITNVENLDATCYALEAMAYYGKEMVTPEFYERTLTLKRFKDEDSGDMLDLIFRNRFYDLGTVFNFNNGADSNGTLGFYTDLIGQRSDDIISYYNTRVNVYQAGIDALVAQCYN